MKARKHWFKLEYRVTPGDAEALIPTGKLVDPVVRRYK